MCDFSILDKVHFYFMFILLCEVYDHEVYNHKTYALIRKYSSIQSPDSYGMPNL